MNKLFELKFGSHLYGCDTPNSDLDIKAIYIPNAREIVLGNYKKTISTQRPKSEGERNTKDDVDVEIFSLDRYLKLLAEGQTVALDILFAPNEMFTWKLWRDPIFQTIRENKEKLICKDLAAFIGYSRQQASKYGLKGFRVAALRESVEFLEQLKPNDKLSDEAVLPMVKKFVYERPCANPAPKNEFITLEMLDNKHGKKDEYLKVCDKYYSLNARVKDIKDQIQRRFDQYGQRAMQAELNQGIDWKALSHAVRVNSQGVELLNTGHITFPRPDRELLLKIKTGQMEYAEVADIIVEGLEVLKGSQANSSLREKPDHNWIDEFIFNVYSEVVKNDN